MSDHEVALEILIASRQKYLQSAISLIRKARNNKEKANIIIKHANEFHRARAKSLLASIKALRNDIRAKTEYCRWCAGTGILSKGTNEYETDIKCTFCYGI